MDANDDILFERRGDLGLVTLNRPKALNALTLGMIRAFSPRLRDWAADPAVKTIAIAGAGDRAFCAGGDIRAVYDAALARRGTLTADFFREEYRLNHQIFSCPKPYVALIDGVTMGGGVGLSVHGAYRVITERSLFAMPETGIGLFPDVGGSYFLPRCPGRLGMYLALTGVRLKAADMLYVGYATHYVPSAKLRELCAALEQAPADAVLSRFAEDPGAAPLAEIRERIDRCFAGTSLEAIIEALRGEGGAWAEQTLATLSRMSPTSLKVTCRQVEAGARLSFEECMKMEYRLTQRFMAGHDFYEGVRAILVDKDNQPRWRPATLAEVTTADIDAYFVPLGERELHFRDI